MRKLGLPLPLTGLSVVLAACATGSDPAATPAPATRVDTVVVVDTVNVSDGGADPELEARLSRLQIQLLERDAQLRERDAELEETRQEVVRNLAKLQSQATRAEAASGLAEAEIAIQGLSRRQGARDLDEFAQAQARLDAASAEFAAENYSGAVYLATQARGLATTAQGRLRTVGTETLREGESRFAAPLRLRTSGRSNVRGGPGLNFPVLFTLDAGMELVGQSYTSQWVRVLDVQGREGWIFHTLVTGR